MVRTLIRSEELGAALKRARKDRGMSLRDVENETGISFATLARIERQVGSPTPDNLTSITEWLNIPIARILSSDAADQPVVFYPHEKTPDIVQAYIDRDPNLTEDQKRGLGEFFRVAYAQFARK
ncbi:MAG: helix-turn-helix transcriptional regulator [Pyrinomonadaceae bacterium]